MQNITRNYSRSNGHLIVSQYYTKKLKETNLSHYEMIRQFVEKLKSWGKVTFIGWNNIEFDQIFLRNTLFQNLQNILFPQQQMEIKREIYLIWLEQQISIIQIL